MNLDDEQYNALMGHIEAFLPNDAKDIKLGSVLGDIDENFFSKLNALLGDDECADLGIDALMAGSVNSHLDESLCAFLENGHFGSTRLISWPDRLLNTIDTTGDGAVYLYRPTAINYYPHAFDDSADWFRAWTAFMHDTGMAILRDNKHNKYAQKYAQHGDDNTFLCLNVILLAMFDAILIFMLFEIQNKTNIPWQTVKAKLFEIINKNKMERTVEILNEHYGDVDVMFLQEVRNNFDRQLLPEYHVVFPERTNKNNQTSVVALKKTRFARDRVTEITSQVKTYSHSSCIFDFVARAAFLERSIGIPKKRGSSDRFFMCSPEFVIRHESAISSFTFFFLLWIPIDHSKDAARGSIRM